jgi:hypothetical protein
MSEVKLDLRWVYNQFDVCVYQGYMHHLLDMVIHCNKIHVTLHIHVIYTGSECGSAPQIKFG